MHRSYLALGLLILATATASHGWGQTAGDASWRAIPLIQDAKVAPVWGNVGWGHFSVAGDTLRTEPDERGMGLLVYTREKLGNCQVRVVFKSQNPKCNSGVYIRMDDGILGWTNRPSVAVHREANGKLSKEMLQKLMTAAEAEEGPWYAVHHGFEVQIMDDADPLHRTAAIYGLAKAAPLPLSTNDGWRTMIITLRGDAVVVEVDGKRTTQFDSASIVPPANRKWTEPKLDIKRPTTGYIGLQAHDPGDIVWFKEVSVRPLPK